MVLKKTTINKNPGQLLIFSVHKNHFGNFKNYVPRPISRYVYSVLILQWVLHIYIFKSPCVILMYKQG